MVGEGGCGDDCSGKDQPGRLGNLLLGKCWTTTNFVFLEFVLLNTLYRFIRHLSIFQGMCNQSIESLNKEH